ncbi:syntaxin-19 isoform X2 [Moschus berezovskii]|uniref:syntaxin-19 isoform X2 n=1 Tax=Moschus berezovskii TaxID=68408 RepID=UPI002444B8BA|nr:syntaxin-19 isoform X2 [Moschus berezovskii]
MNKMLQMILKIFSHRQDSNYAGGKARKTSQRNKTKSVLGQGRERIRTSTDSWSINYLGSQPAKKLDCKLQLLLVKLDAIRNKGGLQHGNTEEFEKS